MKKETGSSRDDQPRLWEPRYCGERSGTHRNGYIAQEWLVRSAAPPLTISSRESWMIGSGNVVHLRYLLYIIAVEYPN
jgi:hypothetical protein